VLAYFDASALIKRVADECESGALGERRLEIADGGGQLATSSLAWIEVTRALRAPGDHRRHLAGFAGFWATAVIPDADVVISYDPRLNAAASEIGMTVESPGAAT